MGGLYSVTNVAVVEFSWHAIQCNYSRASIICSSVADLKMVIQEQAGVPADLQALYRHNPAIKGG